MEKPSRSVVVCGTQRSGTTLLCWALTDTGALGRPGEYFLDGDPSQFAPGWTFWEDGPLAKEHGVSDRRSYLELVYRVGTTPNGVFGLKLMWNNLTWVAERLNALPEFADMSAAEWFPLVFPDLRPVHIVRRDRVRQAISWLKAAQDGVWVLSEERPAHPLARPAYDFEVLVGIQRLIVDGENGWRRLFQAIGVNSCEIVYEELAKPDGYEATVRRVAEHVGVDVADITIPRPRSQRQADATNDEWFERYLADEQARKVRSNAGYGSESSILASSLDESDGRGCTSPVATKPFELYRRSAGFPRVTQSETLDAFVSVAHAVTASTSAAPTRDDGDAARPTSRPARQL